MIDFSSTTPFRLARELAVAGQSAPSLYLLVCDDRSTGAVQADLVAEIEIQLGFKAQSVRASDVRPEKLEDTFKQSAADWSIVLLIFDRWLPKLVDSIDRNVVLLTQAGTVLLIANRQIAERVLVGAPNLRNRITDVLCIEPDEALRGTRA